jgi:hypothetical protein
VKEKIQQNFIHGWKELQNVPKLRFAKSDFQTGKVCSSE